MYIFNIFHGLVFFTKMKVGTNTNVFHGDTDTVRYY